MRKIEVNDCNDCPFRISRDEDRECSIMGDYSSPYLEIDDLTSKIIQPESCPLKKGDMLVTLTQTELEIKP